MSTYEESLDILSKLGIAREPNGSTKKNIVFTKLVYFIDKVKFLKLI